MKKLNILIVDDNPLNIHILRTLIEDEYDAKFYLETNAKDAVSVLFEANIDIIFADIMMPNISGIDFVSYIQEIEDLKNIPVVLVSDIYNSDEIKDELSKLKIQSFLSKPLIIEELYEQINQVYLQGA